MDIKTLGNFVVVDIYKPLNVQPLYDYVRVRKDYFVRAKRINKKVLVRTPNGEVVLDPTVFMKKSKVHKEVMLYPDNPMLMYNVMVDHCAKKPDDAYIFQ